MGGLLWPDESLYALPVLVVAILAIEVVRRRRRRGRVRLAERVERGEVQLVRAVGRRVARAISW